MLTEKDYCDYETCVALKELGYVGLSRFFYATKESPLRRYSYDQILTTRIADAVGHTLAISLYVAQKWLREEKNLHIEVRWYSNLWYEYEVKEAEGKILAEGSAFKTYEEALSTAIYMATEHLKEEEK